MGELITSKGRNTKEAVDIALALLGKELSEVEVEIVEHEEKGFLGFKSKPAVVKVKVKDEVRNESQSIEQFLSTIDNEHQDMMNNKVEPQSIEQFFTTIENVPPEEVINENNHSQSIEEFLSKIDDKQRDEILHKSPTQFNQDDLSGKAWVLNGRVFCKDAANKYPLIETTTGVRIFKNGRLINSTEVISETDVIKTDIVNDKVPPVWDIKISDDELEVHLITKVGMEINRMLKDKEPSSKIKLEVVEMCKPIVINPSDVINQLKELGIVHGIDYPSIHKASSSVEDGVYLIAKGTPATKGKNGFFKLFEDFEIKNQLKERMDGSVDFRETREFPSVDFGQIIGEIIPPQEGIPGMTVSGDVIPPEEGYPVLLRAGTGVILVGDDKVVSTESGYPEVKIKGQLTTVSVIPKLVIPNDVTFETGNVHYLGAVEINGSIQDSMTVEARGNILVKGNVFRAKVLSGKSIMINKNVIASHLTSGNGSLIKLKLSDSLMKLVSLLNTMNAAIDQLTQVSAFKVKSLQVTGLGPLINILCNSKFKELPPLIHELVNTIRLHSSELEREWLDFAEILYRDFVNIHISTLRNVEDLANISKIAESLSISVKTENEGEPSFIQADFVQNSELYSSGDIIISGQGVYSSNLFARKNIMIRGFVRGGEIYGEDSVTINEVGNRAGSYVKVAVSKNGVIKIKSAAENTTIQVGGQSRILFNKAKNIVARLDNIGSLVISKEE